MDLDHDPVHTRRAAKGRRSAIRNQAFTLPARRPLMRTFRQTVLQDLEPGAVAVHDRYQPYDSAKLGELNHRLCLAHVLRDLASAAELCPNQTWPNQLADELRELIHRASQARMRGETSLPQRIKDLGVRALRAAARHSASRRPARSSAVTAHPNRPPSAHEPNVYVATSVALEAFTCLTQPVAESMKQVRSSSGSVVRSSDAAARVYSRYLRRTTVTARSQLVAAPYRRGRRDFLCVLLRGVRRLLRVARRPQQRVYAVKEEGCHGQFDEDGQRGGRPDGRCAQIERDVEPCVAHQ